MNEREKKKFKQLFNRIDKRKILYMFFFGLGLGIMLTVNILVMDLSLDFLAKVDTVFCLWISIICILNLFEKVFEGMEFW